MIDHILSEDRVSLQCIPRRYCPVCHDFLAITRVCDTDQLRKSRQTAAEMQQLCEKVDQRVATQKDRRRLLLLLSIQEQQELNEIVGVRSKRILADMMRVQRLLLEDLAKKIAEYEGPKKGA
jgi:hypothetical protein